MTLKQKVATAPAGNEWLPNPALAQTAAGNSQGTAYAIPAGQDLTVFSSVPASSGARMPSAGVSVTEEYVIANHDAANALLVYPPTGGKMGNAATNAGYSLAAGKTGYFLCVGQLGSAWTVNP